MKIIEDFMTVKEAAEYLGYTLSAVCNICRRGGFPDARRAGERVWLIPKQSVVNYRRGLQGFAAVQARKRADEAAQRARIEEALGITGQAQTGQDEASPQYFSVEDAAKTLNMPKRRIRHLCLWGRLEGASKVDGEWFIPARAISAMAVKEKKS